LDAEHSMTDNRDRSKAEKPKQRPRIGGGTTEGTSFASQTDTACEEPIRHEVMVTIEEVLSRENMMAACYRVVRNRGAPGFDGMTVDELWDWCCEHWHAIREAIRGGTYQPSPVLKVEIPKPGGKGVRTLGIPTVVDRLIQQALLQVLTPLFDPTFSESSFGFRPKRSAHQALDQAKEHIAAGHRWVVDMDLEKFFDRVNHDVLMARLARRIKDKRILKLIRRFLQAGMMDGGTTSPRSEGTPQGGPLSPLLSNVLLDEFDKELEQRGHRFVRYADDCNIYVRSQQAGQRVLGSVERFLQKRLRLQVNREKSAVDRPWKRKFLGYTFTRHLQPRFKVAPESVKRFKDRLRTEFRKARGRNVRRMLAELRPKLIGWVSYYRKSEVKKTFEELDKWIRRKLRAIMWRQWKRSATRARKMIHLGLAHARAWTSAMNGRGPWWNAGASHMNQAVPTRMLSQLGLVNLVNKAHELRR
jgi:RNA-directed DNA polymerase